MLLGLAAVNFPKSVEVRLACAMQRGEPVRWSAGVVLVPSRCPLLGTVRDVSLPVEYRTVDNGKVGHRLTISTA